MHRRSSEVLRVHAKSFADYAAIAVAPLLIFFMISSLANFLMLVFYHGPYPLRVAWIVLMFTMGFVAIARVAIEQNRAYSLGYAVILGFVGWVAMTRFVGSPIFSGFILVVIAYLADRIVNDCTLIDDTVDASGQGLVDFAKGVNRPRRSSQNQPGRTVMYLALASLPLFGVGQWMLRQDGETWQRAQWLLAVYLFSSFSLLVTTSFLGLRRYLRQRGVEMPRNVSIAWLAGGLGLTAAIISLAYFIPLPGSMLAAVEMPPWLESVDDFSASRFGWGREGAGTSQAGDASTDQDSQPDGKQTQQVQARKGAPPGDSGDGEGEKGPAGKQDGGKQQTSQQDSPASQPSESKPSESKPSESKPSESKPSESKPSESKSSEAKSSEAKSSEAKSSESKSSESKSGESKSGESKSGESKSGESKSAGEQSPTDRDEASSTESDSSEPSASQAADPPSQPPRSDSPSSSPSKPSLSLGDFFSTLGKLFRLLVFVILLGIVSVYLWLHRQAIARWWQGLWGADRSKTEASSAATGPLDSTEPPRSFASFRNPIGREPDPRRVMVITFQAFEAWTREHGWTREKDETPSEFLQRVAVSVPQMSGAATHVVDAYNRIVYGRGRATQRDLEAAKQVWQAMN